MGLGSLKSAWQRQTLYFGHQHRDRYSVLVTDNRGIGASDKPLLRYSTSEMARDLVEVLRHVGWLAPAGGAPHVRSAAAGAARPRDRVHVVGISLGGMIAQELACLMPAHVCSLSLCCTAAAIENTSTFAENMALRASMLVPKSVEKSVHTMGLQLFPAAWLVAPDDVTLPDPATMPRVRPPRPGSGDGDGRGGGGGGGGRGPAGEYLLFNTNGERFVAQEMHKRLDPRASSLKGFLLQLVAAGWHRKTPAQLKEMADRIGRDRILVMHGTLDGMIDVKLGRKLVEYVGPGSVHLEDGMGHAPIVERSEWFNHLIERQVEQGERLDGRAQ